MRQTIPYIKIIIVVNIILLIPITGYLAWQRKKDWEKSKPEKIFMARFKNMIDNSQDVNLLTDGMGHTLLHRAAQEGYIRVIELLLEKKADVNLRDNIGATPLHRASEEGQVEAVEILLKHGADLEAKDEQRGGTPLYYAALYSRSSVDVFSLLLDHGADIEATDKTGYTPLHTAASSGNNGIVKLSINQGADVNARNDFGLTPLHSAVYGNARTCEILLQNGADINAEGVYCGTPLDLTVNMAGEFDKSKKEVIKILQKYGGKNIRFESVETSTLPTKYYDPRNTVYEVEKRSLTISIIANGEFTVRHHTDVVDEAEDYDITFNCLVEEGKMIEPNQWAIIVPDNYPDMVFGGKVIYIDRHNAQMIQTTPVSENKSKFFPVKIDIDERPEFIQDGMSGKAEIIIRILVDVIYLPHEAVIDLNGQKVCHVIRDDESVEIRPIQTGDFNNEFVEIKQGLKEGEKVSIKFRIIRNRQLYLKEKYRNKS